LCLRDRNDSTTKAIIFTAHSDQKFLSEAESLQLTRYLVKPVSRKDLKDALDFSIDELLKSEELENHNNTIKPTGDKQ
jgi:YesN/AraC family two-component response regulator